MWHCVTVKDATHWNLLNILNSSIWSLTSWIMYSIVAIQATPWKVQCWVAVPLYHDVPCKVVFTLPVFCRVHWPWANRFCTMKSFQSLLSAYDVSASDPVVLWNYHGSLHRKAKLCGSSCSLENCVVEASRSTKNCPIKKSWLQYSDTSCPSMVFNDSLWNLIGFKLICPWQKLPQDHAWKVA